MTALLTACERVANLAAKADHRKVDPALLVERAEQELYQVYQGVKDMVAKKMAAADYRGALAELVQLSGPIDAFSTRSW